VLDAPSDVVDAIAASGFTVLDFTVAHAAAMRDLPWHHRDPFDRMLVSQALAEGLTLLSADRRVQAYFAN
jgi:PIN domain nuclease of toxin-antitoxin system